MNIRIETWAGHKIRFVEKDGEWWAVLADIAAALDLTAKRINERLPKDVVSNAPLSTAGGQQMMLIVNEYGIYEAVFESRKKEAKEFKRWVYEMLKTLRQLSGLEGFQVFRMLDKDHQKEAMAKLNTALRKPVKVDFIKANTIANKAVSNKYGYPKMVKKEAMSPEMLVDRQPILEDTVNLMGLADKYGLDISVSKAIYNGLAQTKVG
ncbi:MAG TPA: phage repressor protein [Lachnospiraceae bacterium]|jgi:prophage antirepressor-like protein|nr:phage repressor protein [Lachnospiraceae bacterium]HCA69336.1 phage repressor protein [Lachnospiraceae bacterium]HCM12757.1 phage repressor protein [Lachnospiraceae bacterium]HCR39387.1 phage repressor protein [Lachnospiraceae bacterium]